MDPRRQWLQHLATSSAVAKWASSCDLETLRGTSRVETRNTTYLFRNGNCFAVTHRDPARGTLSELLGMRLVGWLVVEGRDPRLTRTWRPGAFAVLWGLGGDDTLPVALTSATVRHTHFVATGIASDAPGRPRLDRKKPVTLTRVNLPTVSELATSEVRRIARAAR